MNDKDKIKRLTDKLVEQTKMTQDIIDRLIERRDFLGSSPCSHGSHAWISVNEEHYFTKQICARCRLARTLVVD